VTMSVRCWERWSMSCWRMRTKQRWIQVIKLVWLWRWTCHAAWCVLLINHDCWSLGYVYHRLGRVTGEICNSVELNGLTDALTGIPLWVWAGTKNSRPVGFLL
jgi:hypothetical protein